MAINPNTDFTSAVLTSSQMNRFPRGVMAFASSTTSSGSITAEATQLTTASFTAVANRYYRITYYEPDMLGGTTYLAQRLRLTNVSGTKLQESYQHMGGAVDRFVVCQIVTTLSAGATVILGTMQSASGSTVATRSSTTVAWLNVEDIGPA